LLFPELLRFRSSAVLAAVAMAGKQGGCPETRAKESRWTARQRVRPDIKEGRRRDDRKRSNPILRLRDPWALH
jgi:hypothetical protein